MPYPEDDLDRLIRITLRKSTAKEEPPAEVWTRIAARIGDQRCGAALRDSLWSEPAHPPLPITLQLVWPGMPLIRL